MANFHSINTSIVANLKLLRVEVGTLLCSEGQQGIPAPTPRSWTQPNSQLACPQLLPQTHPPSPRTGLPLSLQLVW